MEQKDETQSKDQLPMFSRLVDNTYFQPKKIVIKLSSPEVGIGVFATEDIEENELVERCPMIQMGWKNRYHGDPQIHNYLYPNSRCGCDDCKINGNSLFMVLGYGMLYNHRDEPNTRWDFNFKNLIGDVIATKPIKSGEQIFVSYGPNYFKYRNKIDI